MTRRDFLSVVSRSLAVVGLAPLAKFLPAPTDPWTLAKRFDIPPMSYTDEYFKTTPFVTFLRNERYLPIAGTTFRYADPDADVVCPECSELVHLCDCGPEA